MEARYLASTGKPWDLMAWGFDRGKDQGWSLKSGLHLQQEAAVVLMQGGGFQVYNQPTRSGYLIPAVIEQLGEVADFCRERQAPSHQSRTVPQVALLLSETSLWERMDRVFSPWHGEFDELEGALRQTRGGRLCLHLLNRSNFPVPDRYIFVSDIPAIGPIKISLKLAARPRALHWLPEGKRLKWTWQDGCAKTTIPSLHIHGMLAVD